MENWEWRGVEGELGERRAQEGGQCPWSGTGSGGKPDQIWRLLLLGHVDVTAKLLDATGKFEGRQN